METESGCAGLPSRPGLVMDLNEEAASRHPYVPGFRHTFVWPGGSVADA